MCGIFAVTNDANAAQTVLTGLKKLEYRGYDSWGIAVPINGKKAKVEKHVGRISVAKSVLPHSAVGVGHTRWATHGGVTQANAHPHTDCTGRFVVVHNGILENYQELLKKKLAGHTIKSQTDTEVFAHLIENAVKQRTFVEAVRHVFKVAHGLNALVALDSTTGTIVAAKFGSPLIVGRDATRFFISSDLASLAGQANHIRPLDDGEMVVIEHATMKLFDVQTDKEKPLKLEVFTMKLEETTKGKFAHYMLKEIHEQPGVLANVLAQNESALEEIAARAKKAQRVTLVGCGSAYYACLAAKYMFASLGQKHVDVYQGNELMSFVAELSKDTYTIFVSQSGETIDLVQPALKLHKAGIRIACLTNVYNSSLYRISNDRVLLSAGPEICVATTKAFTSMLEHLALLVGMVSGKEKQVRVDLARAIISVKTLLAPVSLSAIRATANTLAQSSNAFVLGRAVSYPLALEAALKMKEISYIHAEGFAGGELKHGMIALIEKGTPCLVVSPSDDTYQESISNAAEVKARGGYMIGIGSKNNAIFDDFVRVADAGSANTIPLVVAVQLLAYYTALMLKRDIDKPRNLAKSVVVK